MKFWQYIRDKYGTEDFHSLTQAEADIVGVPYPLQNGWLALHGETIITNDMRDALVQVLSDLALKKWHKKAGRYAARALSTLGASPLQPQKQCQPQVDVMPVGMPTTRPSSSPASETKKQRKRRLRQERKAAAEATIRVVEVVREVVVTTPTPSPKRTKQRRTTEANVKTFISHSSIDPASDAFLRSFEWRAARMMAIKRYGPVCQCCGASPKTGAVINVDHIKPRKLFPELALDQDNLQVLCNDCNAGKGNWDQTDWRVAA